MAAIPTRTRTRLRDVSLIQSVAVLNLGTSPKVLKWLRSQQTHCVGNRLVHYDDEAC